MLCYFVCFFISINLCINNNKLTINIFSEPCVVFLGVTSEKNSSDVSMSPLQIWSHSFQLLGPDLER